MIKEAHRRLVVKLHLDHGGSDFLATKINRARLPSGWFGTWTAGDDVALEMAMYRAYHRWMDDYCSAYPSRLGGVILAGARDIEGALTEIRRCGRARAWGMMVYAPVGMPLDHPVLEPLYAEAAELAERRHEGLRRPAGRAHFLLVGTQAASRQGLRETLGAFVALTSIQLALRRLLRA